MTLPRTLTTQKEVGETPLIALERLRKEHGIPHDVPLAYAGRLDPMASGKLLILVGDECKVQEKYHAFDKEYNVEVLLGISSDTGDVLGLLSERSTTTPVTLTKTTDATESLVGTIELPYPHFSSKTVLGKPLHMWTLENRLSEITIPTKKSVIYSIHDVTLRTISKTEVLKTVRAKIETIPKVTDPKKALGEDFRRDSVRSAWDAVERNAISEYQIISFTCVASSGTYMRSLGEKIADALGTGGLAYSIHRTKIGTYARIPFTRYGLWIRQF